MRAPAVPPSDVIKPLFLVVRVRTAGDEIVVRLVLNVLIQWHNVDVLQANVDANSRLAEPEEITLLFDVSNVVRGLQMTGFVQVLHEQVRRRFHAKSYASNSSTSFTTN